MILRRPSRFIKPCLPSKVARPPSGSFWVHEINRGYRAGAYRGYRNGVGAAAVGAAAVGAAAAVVAATMPTATGFAHRIERRDTVGLCKRTESVLRWSG